MLLHKTITFLDELKQRSLGWVDRHFALSDAERACANRLDQTSSAKVLVENETGLKTVLEDMVIDGASQLFCMRVALNGLGNFNTELGHDGADEVLQATIAHIAAKFPDKGAVRFFRSGSDWVLVFSGKNAQENQKVLATWLIKKENRLYIEKNDRYCELSVLAPIMTLSAETLPLVYQVINALRPGKNTVVESLKDIRGVSLKGVTANILATSSAESFDAIAFSPEKYLGMPKEYVPALLEKAQADNLQKLFSAGAQHEEEFKEQWLIIVDHLVENKVITDATKLSLLDAEQYMREHRLEERYVFMKDAQTMVVPVTNAFGEVVFALKLHLREPVADWNNELRRIKYTSDKQPTYRVQADNSILESFRYPPLNKAMDSLMYLRRFDTAYALMEPTGRTMFFGRTVAPYLDYLMHLSQEKLEALPADLTVSLELRMVARILLRDGYVLLRNGGEEFFVLARDKRNNWFGLAYDYNKFSRFGTTFGEGASDRYMQRSAGILRTEISNILTKHYVAGKSYSAKYLAAVLQRAVVRLNKREIIYAVPPDILQRPIRTKAGKLIYAIHKQAQWYLFAGDDTGASEVALQLAITNSGLVRTPEEIAECLRCAKALGPLTAETVLTVINRDNTAIRKKDGRIEVDLNKVLGVNPKAVFTGETFNTDAILLHPGILLQGLLSGLSLAGSVIAWDGKASLRELIVIADTLAEKAKEKANEKPIALNNLQQETLVDFQGKIQWKDPQTIVIMYGVH